MIWELVWKDIMAMVPIYGDDGGNYTEVWFTNGSKMIVRNRTTTVVNQLAKVFAVDISQLKVNMGKKLGQKRGAPLPLTDGLWLIPISYRIPLGENHGATGYVVFQKLVAVGNGEVTFKNGEVLTCLSKGRTLNGLVGQCIRMGPGGPYGEADDIVEVL